MPSGDLYPTARSDAAIIYCALWRPCVAFQQFLSGVFLVEAQPPPGRVLRPGRDSAFRAASEPLGSLLEWRADLDVVIETIEDAKPVLAIVNLQSSKELSQSFGFMNSAATSDETKRRRSRAAVRAVP